MAKTDRRGDWLISFLDMSMLLLAFFLILASQARETPTFIHSQEGTGYRSITTGDRDVLVPIWELMADLETELQPEMSSNRLVIQPHWNEIRLHFTDAQFFETASADLSPEGKALIDRLVTVLDGLRLYEYHIDVEGHTDDRPIQTLRFRSNWELSASRAATIVRDLMARGFPSDRLKASGYADTKPVAPNRDASGQPLPEQMALNRRIVFRIHYDLVREAS